MRFDLLKILVVDDNHHMRELLMGLLRAIGVRHLYEAADGSHALSIMRSASIDIVITDLTMQPLDGVDFVRLLRTSPDSPNTMVPVIMVTGHSTQRHVEEARDAGVNEFLTKPVTARGIIDRICLVIENARPYVRTASYFGPERRRRNDPNFTGPWRRSGDAKKTADAKK